MFVADSTGQMYMSATDLIMSYGQGCYYICLLDNSQTISEKSEIDMICTIISFAGKGYL